MPSLVGRARGVLHGWRSRPAADWLVAAVVLGGHGLLVALTGHGDIFGTPDREQRLEIYTTGATVVALVGSFVTAAIAQYASATGRRMRVLRTAPQLASQFRRNWVSVLSATLLIAAVCLLAIVLDTTKTDPGGVHWAVEGALLLGAARAYRLLWLFDAVIRATDRDLADAPQMAPQGPPAAGG
ncbi:hypothetical protein ACIBWG_18295 [Streptomyces griseoaurantiacus]|uniref:hypothetical protein n=1 Tax=Streptomyces TaxID=1883 RepID=UPI0029A462A7|nr:hypothetical protein [Streptomyces sp. ME02-6978.2a]MDX3361604.1 hypothetical protein [Streptomyces sp. ME02-6978.2a]WTI28335.1 hypothetical protein OHA67_19460 [Streptomyces jietaisiensis]